MKIAIVGTGFAGFGATSALILDADIEINVFDIGLTNKTSGTKDEPVPNAKSASGSYFPYGVNDARWYVKLISKRISSSHAYGGYSTVYSGAILYPKNEDLEEWPEESRPLALDYQSVMRFFNVLYVNDELAKEFPPIPSQYDLENANDATKMELLGLSRIAQAIKSEGQERDRKIFCTAEYFKDLVQKKRITYKPNVYLLKVGKTGKKLQLYLENRDKKQEKCGNFDAVFLGAGCINTTGIVDRSLFGVGTREYHLKSPVGFINAFCRFGFSMDKDHQIRRNANLPEFFLETKSASTFKTWSHTQITAINDQIISAISSKIPFFGITFGKLFRNFIYFAQTAGHSRFGKSTPVKATTRQSHKGVLEYSILIEERNQFVDVPQFRSSLFQAVRKNWKKLKMVPIPFGSQLADFFRGNKLGGWHYGGTLPMKHFPKVGQCYPCGAVAGLDGLYVVDSAAFPEIPGSTVALLIAANSHRVARQWKNKVQQKEKYDLCQ